MAELAQPTVVLAQPEEQQRPHFPLELAMPKTLPSHAIRENLEVERLKTRSPHQEKDEWEVGHSGAQD